MMTFSASCCSHSLVLLVRVELRFSQLRVYSPAGRVRPSRLSTLNTHQPSVRRGGPRFANSHSRPQPSPSTGKAAGPNTNGYCEWVATNSGTCRAHAPIISVTKKGYIPIRGDTWQPQSANTAQGPCKFLMADCLCIPDGGPEAGVTYYHVVHCTTFFPALARSPRANPASGKSVMMFVLDTDSHSTQKLMGTTCRRSRGYWAAQLLCTAARI